MLHFHRACYDGLMTTKRRGTTALATLAAVDWRQAGARAGHRLGAHSPVEGVMTRADGKKVAVSWCALCGRTLTGSGARAAKARRR